MTHENGRIDTLIGKTLQWTFVDGPTAGMTFEHSFYENGNVSWRSVKGGVRGKATREKNCAALNVADGIFAVSYLAASGYTLTVVLNFKSGQVIGFASNGSEWFQQKGTFEILDQADDD